MRDVNEARYLLLAWFVLLVLGVSNFWPQINGKEIES